MGYTFKLSRRLAQVHICFLAMAALACADAVSSPEPAAEGVSDSLQNGIEIAGPQFSMSTTNQPSNFLPLSSRPFNFKVESGWKDRGDIGFSIATDAGAPASPSNIGRAHYQAGFRGGAAPINTWYMVPGKKNNIYLSFWVKLSSNWLGHTSGVNKIFFFQINRGNKVYLTAQGSGNTPLLLPQVRVQGINENPVTRNLYSNVNAFYMQRGIWYRWEVILRSNSNGQPNGIAEWWVNGTKVGSYSNVNFVAAGANRFWEAVKWNPTWGGTGSQIVNPQDMWIDEAYVSGI
jgi:hypothetical protein